MGAGAGGCRRRSGLLRRTSHRRGLRRRRRLLLASAAIPAATRIAWPQADLGALLPLHGNGPCGHLITRHHPALVEVAPAPTARRGLLHPPATAATTAATPVLIAVALLGLLLLPHGVLMHLCDLLGPLNFLPRLPSAVLEVQNILQPSGQAQGDIRSD